MTCIFVSYAAGSVTIGPGVNEIVVVAGTIVVVGTGVVVGTVVGIGVGVGVGGGDKGEEHPATITKPSIIVIE